MTVDSQFLVPINLLKEKRKTKFRKKWDEFKRDENGPNTDQNAPFLHGQSLK